MPPKSAKKQPAKKSAKKSAKKQSAKKPAKKRAAGQNFAAAKAALKCNEYSIGEGKKAKTVTNQVTEGATKCLDELVRAFVAAHTEVSVKKMKAAKRQTVTQRDIFGNDISTGKSANKSAGKSAGKSASKSAGKSKAK